MKILLIARDTMYNKLVRQATASDWGHSSVVIDDIVYDFDVGNKSKNTLSSVVKNKSVTKATLFDFEMIGGEPEAEELYKDLFDRCKYDISSLMKLNTKCKNGGDMENIQTSPDSYTCSSLIARVGFDSYRREMSMPEIMKGIHWSQIIPNHFSSLNNKKDLVHILEDE